MSARPFLDTNILVYAFSSEHPRSETALSLVANGGIVSIQVLNEFASVARQKLFREWDEIEEAIRALRTLLEPPLPLTMEIHQAAIHIARNYNYRFYDGLIIAAALQAGCSTVYTEHLQNGQTIEKLTIRNPFIGT
jgi:predicted nucleic acid-binding protein